MNGRMRGMIYLYTKGSFDPPLQLSLLYPPIKPHHFTEIKNSNSCSHSIPNHTPEENLHNSLNQETLKMSNFPKVIPAFTAHVSPQYSKERRERPIAKKNRSSSTLPSQSAPSPVAPPSPSRPSPPNTASYALRPITPSKYHLFPFPLPSSLPPILTRPLPLPLPLHLPLTSPQPSLTQQVDATFLHGSDFIRADPSGKHLRLEVNSVLKDKSGAVISYKYSGILNLSPGVAAVLGGGSDAKTTGFGDASEFPFCFSLPDVYLSEILGGRRGRGKERKRIVKGWC